MDILIAGGVTKPLEWTIRAIDQTNAWTNAIGVLNSGPTTPAFPIGAGEDERE